MLGDIQQFQTCNSGNILKRDFFEEFKKKFNLSLQRLKNSHHFQNYCFFLIW